MKYISIDIKKILSLSTGLILGASACAGEFQPSHALAAKLRFQAHRDGQFFEDWTPSPETRSEMVGRIQKNNDARRKDLLEELAAQVAAHQKKAEAAHGDDSQWMERILEIEKMIADSNVEEADPDESQSLKKKDDDTFWAAAGGGIAGAAMVGLAAVPFLRRRNSLSDAT